MIFNTKHSLTFSILLAIFCQQAEAINFRYFATAAIARLNKKNLAIAAAAFSYIVAVASWQSKTGPRITNENLHLAPGATVTINNDGGKITLQPSQDNESHLTTSRFGSINGLFPRLSTLAASPQIGQDDQGNITIAVHAKTGHANTSLWARFLNFVLHRIPEHIDYILRTPRTTRVNISNQAGMVTVDNFIDGSCQSQSVDIRTKPGNPIAIINCQPAGLNVNRFNRIQYNGRFNYQYNERRYVENGHNLRDYDYILRNDHENMDHEASKILVK
jgi:hypothetical protein